MAESSSRDLDAPRSVTGSSEPTRSLIRARWFRAALLVPAGAALLIGLNAGLQRLGLPAPVNNGRLANMHGTLMVLGFLGTLIALERAVAAGRLWAYLSPALFGLGAVATSAPLPDEVGNGLLLAGALALIAVYVPLYRRQRDNSVAIQLVGAAMAAGAALLVLRDVAVPLLLPWLAGFVVLTIGGERLELARVAALEPSAPGAVLAIVAPTARQACSHSFPYRWRIRFSARVCWR
ncbi:MAG: hypothetical protein ACK5MR_10660 [Cumulibacter sp.]